MNENRAQPLPKISEVPHFGIRDYSSYEDAASESKDDDQQQTSAYPTVVFGEGNSPRKSYSSSQAIENHAAPNAAATVYQDTSGHTAEIAEEKTDTRRRDPARVKRGGRQYSGGRAPSFWRLWNGGPYAIGDLVEAEWMGTGWWYVGYVNGKDAGNGEREGMYHVVFADGDEADVRGKYLKWLRPPGHTEGSAGTLPRHVPIVDLGTRTGRLHRDAPSSAQQQREYSGSPLTNSDKEKAGNDEATKEHMDGHGGGKTLEVASAPEADASLRLGSSKTISDRQQQGEQSGVRGRIPTQPIVPDRWWATGTQYALQPHIAESKPTTASIGDAGYSIECLPENGVFSSQAASNDIDGSERRNRQLLRVLQPGEGNEARGKRIFFLA